MVFRTHEDQKFRLQDERGDKGIRLSGLAIASRKVYVVVDMMEGKR